MYPKKLRWFVFSFALLALDSCDSALTMSDGGPSSADLAGDSNQDGSMAATGVVVASNVQIIVEPSDGGQALVTAIQNATTSVHMTMYLLSNTDVINAIIAQKNAGHDVKVILNKTFPDAGSSNTSSYNTLKNAGVNVVWASAKYTYTHEKCVILDGAQAWIMTMNATKSSPTDNREYLAIDSGVADVAEAEAVFQADFAAKDVSFAGPLILSPVNARDSISAFIASATTSVDLEVESLSDYQVVGALTMKGDAGAQVRVVLSDASASNDQTQSVALLKQHHVLIKQLSKPYVHGKAIVVDGKTAFIGSQNFTTNSLINNRELGLLFSPASEVKKVADSIAADFAAGTVL